MTTATNHAPASPQPRALRWSDVAQLTISTGFPCVTITLPTKPAARMTPSDQEELNVLVQQAEQILRATGLTNVGPVISALRGLAASATTGRTGHALALYASRAVQRSFRLPQTSTRRVVVESTFATRELVAALHRTPPHLLLTLYPSCAHVYEAQQHTLVLRSTVHVGDQASTAVDPTDPEELSRLTMDAFLGDVEAELARQRATFPSPLVIAGTPRLIDLFTRRSSHCYRLAGMIDTAYAQTQDELLRRSAVALERYLLARQTDALALVRRAEAGDTHVLASGIEAAWQCARRGQAVMLVVEQSYSVPGRVGGHPMDPQDYEPADPTHVHDLVDDLVEEVIRRGGQVALVDDGALTNHHRVALVTASAHP